MAGGNKGNSTKGKKRQSQMADRLQAQARKDDKKRMNRKRTAR